MRKALDKASAESGVAEAEPEAETDSDETAVNISAADLEDGKYQAAAQGHVDQIELEVTVESGKISDIEILSQNETEGLGDQAVEDITAAIVEEQSLEVDSISGATNSSEAVKNAVRKALDKATAEGGSDG